MLIISIVSVVTMHNAIFTGIILSHSDTLTDSSYMSYYNNAIGDDFVVVDF